jgi:hypothetical protein
MSDSRVYWPEAFCPSAHRTPGEERLRLTLTYSALTSPILYVPAGGSPLLDSLPPDVDDMLPLNDPARPVNQPPPDVPEEPCVVDDMAVSGAGS